MRSLTQGGNRRWATGVLLATLGSAGLTLGVPGCKSPLTPMSDDAARRAVLNDYREALAAIEAEAQVTLSREPSEVEEELTDERREELDEMAGPVAYEADEAELGFDLTGSETASTVDLALPDALQMAARNNLTLSVARLSPKIADEQVTQAEAVFDWVFFANANWQRLDTPQPPGAVTGLSGDTQQDNLTLQTGLRKATTLGTQVQIDTQIRRLEQSPSFFTVSDYYDADLGITVTQPLLRNFGNAANEASIRIAENTREAEVQTLRETLMDVLLATESAYWNLRFSKQRLLIRQRQLARTVELRDKVKARLGFDAPPASLTDANARVELRRSDVIIARALVRQASDELKRVINSPDLSVVGETVLVPTTDPGKSPITFSLLDEVTTALQSRPELLASLAGIRSTEQRRIVAENAELPLLDLTVGAELSGIDFADDDVLEAYEDLSELNYIDYLVGLEFERPLGNRSAEALTRQRRFEQQQAVQDYRRQSQDVVVEVKDALRDVMTSYELVGAQRASRRAAADALRVLQVEQDAGAALTPDFIDRKLQAQDRLADIEIGEVEAIANYNIALAERERATGTLLRREGLEVEPRGR
ncbi:MAG: TolC family protein [Planctomycetota bacterium]